MEARSKIRKLRGDRKTQRYARKAFPVLVRQAFASEPMTYQQLAREIGEHHRAIGRTLGVIGRALEDLSEEWNEEIPPIPALVVNKDRGVPGKGVAQFTSQPSDYKKGSLETKRAIALSLQKDVYSYGRWKEVLAHFDLPQPDDEIPSLPEARRLLERAGYESDSPAESEEHKRLKEVVAKNPEAIGLPANEYGHGEEEFVFHSGDMVDVLFRGPSLVAVEVKSSVSDANDIARGMFQTVKYEALLNATVRAKFISKPTKALLVLEGFCPASLDWLRKVLGVELVEGITSDLTPGQYR